MAHDYFGEILMRTLRRWSSVENERKRMVECTLHLVFIFQDHSESDTNVGHESHLYKTTTSRTSHDFEALSLLQT